MAIRIEFDGEADAVYINVTEGEHARTIEVEPLGIYVDVDSSGNTLGVEFLSWDIFQGYIGEHSGLNIPERFAGPASLVPPNTSST